MKPYQIILLILIFCLAMTVFCIGIYEINKDINDNNKAIEQCNLLKPSCDYFDCMKNVTNLNYDEEKLECEINQLKEEFKVLEEIKSNPELTNCSSANETKICEDRGWKLSQKYATSDGVICEEYKQGRILYHTFECAYYVEDEVSQ